jgi:hypothetical protein
MNSHLRFRQYPLGLVVFATLLLGSFNKQAEQALSQSSSLVPTATSATSLQAVTSAAVSPNSTAARSGNHVSQKIALAEARESPWICGMVGEEWDNTVYYETKNFLVNVCRHKNDETRFLYVGEDRRNGKSIQLPASMWKGAYTAKNGNVTYAVSEAGLVVYRDGNVISNEPVLKEMKP